MRGFTFNMDKWPKDIQYLVAALSRIPYLGLLLTLFAVIIYHITTDEHESIIKKAHTQKTKYSPRPDVL